MSAVLFVSHTALLCTQQRSLHRLSKECCIWDVAAFPISYANLSKNLKSAFILDSKYY